jgi:hypothetical protein
MVIRHAVFLLGIPLYVALRLRSPSEAAFWVILGAEVAVLLPIWCVVAYFYLEIKRLLRERPPT